MKAKIIITESGYKKILIDNEGNKHVEKWERDGCGYKTTDDSVSFEDMDITEELMDSLGSLDFNLGDVCSALETENAVVDEDEEAITDDGHKLKRGDVFYSVAVVMGTNEYTPLRNKYPQDWGWCGSTTYFNRQKCIDECDRRNQSEKEQ